MTKRRQLDGEVEAAAEDEKSGSWGLFKRGKGQRPRKSRASCRLAPSRPPRTAARPPPISFAK